MFFQRATSGNNYFLLYVATMFIVVVGYVLGLQPLVIVQNLQVKNNPEIMPEDVSQFIDTMDFSILKLSSNIGLVLMISIFIFAMLAFMLAIKYLHKLPFQRLITPRESIDWKKMFFGFGLWFVIALVFEVALALMNPETYYLNFKPMSWVFLLLICIFLLPIQTSLEELVFRGYMMPGLSLLTKNKWIPWVVTSMIFGLIHGANPEVERFGFWTMQIYYIGAGLFLGLITILDDSLELALGVHAATNVFGAAFFSFDGSVLQTDSLIKANDVNPYLMSLTFLLGAVIFVVICNKKYNWVGLKMLFEPIGNSKSAITNVDPTVEILD
jgi:membrane protease YdiL (CAAX protease family)